MKLVLAFIQPSRLEAVPHALEQIPRFPGMTHGFAPAWPEEGGSAAWNGRTGRYSDRISFLDTASQSV